jgi:uncharacterized protein YndB with AHSA1/START domain
MEPLELSFRVACSPEHAFTVWATDTSRWWPADHTVSAEPSLTVTFEPRPGGRIFERTRTGVEHDWGEILTWDPPHRLAYLWHLAQDRSDATEVEITFTGDPETTTVTITHRGWDRLGSRGPTLRDRNRTGWTTLLPHYERAAATTQPSLGG